ncbi:MAG: hypothetical protein ACN0LA_02945 [Candidatus Longimicrobiales bacterium M2_2A_002]
MTGPDRAEAMGRRLARTARRLGMDEDGQALVLDAFRVAMEPRRSRIDEDHHPDYLHPARTALILMDDTREADPVTLAAALFTETRDPTLTAPADDLRRVSPEAARLAAEVPVPARTERLLEALLALPEPAARVAAAERLDHARHLHIRPREEWAGVHATTRDAYVPVTRRVDPILAARLDWWCDMFERRFLEG